MLLNWPSPFLMDSLGDQAPHPSTSLLRKTVTVDTTVKPSSHLGGNVCTAVLILLTGG